MADFLGVTDKATRELGPIGAAKEMRDRIVYCTAEVRAVVQTICTADAVPGDYKGVAHSLQVLPAVVEWLQRSAYRRGATTGLALGAAFFPTDWNHDEMSSGWPSESGSVTQEEVDALRAGAAPYADRLLRMDTLVPYQATMDAPGDEPAEERDHSVERPLEAARAGELTTFPVHQWTSTEEQEEAGSPATEEGAEDDGARDGE